MISNLVDRYGAKVVTGAIALLLIVLLVGGLFSCSRIQTWWYAGKAERRTEQRDTARLERDVAKADANQAERATTIATDTVAAQDAHAGAQREATAQSVEVIHERIREVPVPAAVPDDPIVRVAVAQAVGRAQAARRRVLRTPGD